jgi:sugar phosphate isomerase/epimerase
MRIGFFTVCLANLTFKEMVKWASKTGFTTLEVESYPNSKHIDPWKLDSGGIQDIKQVLKKHNMFITDLSYAPNNLDPNEKKRKEHLEHLKKVIEAGEKLQIERVTTFAGRNPNLDMDENIELFQKEFGPVVDLARNCNVKLAIENCPMGFALYGGGNLAHSPKIWDRMFKLFDRTLGLCFDPSHLLWLQIDYMQALRDYMDRIYVVHAKDCEIDRNLLGRVGILDSEWIDMLFTGKTGIGHRSIKWKDPRMQWWRYRIPGLGEIDFKRIINELLLKKYGSDIIIEHEDPIWYGTEKLNKQGLSIGLEYLSQFFPKI